MKIFECNMNLQGTGEKYIMGSFMICTVRQILFKKR